MMKIKSITIEGMHNVSKKTYEFSDLTYLYGPNGSGKSTVMQAIQLALLGYIPETDKRKEAIFRHANSHTMAVTLKLVDNDAEVSIRRIWSGTGSTINSSVEINPVMYDISAILKEIELPIFNFNEFIDMTANKLKEWFIEFLPSSNSTIDWRAELTQGLDVPEHMLDEILTDIDTFQLTGVELIQQVNAHLKSALSFKKKELERAQSTIQSLIYYDDVVPDMTEDDISAKIALYESKKQSRDAVLQSIMKNKSIQDQLAAYAEYSADRCENDPNYIAILESNDQITSRIDELSETFSDNNQQLIALESNVDAWRTKEAELRAEILAKQSIIDSKGICPYTKTSCDSILSIVETYKKEVEELQTELNVVQSEFEACKEAASMCKIKISQIDGEISALRSTLQDNEVERQMMLMKYESKRVLESQLVAIPDDADVDNFDYTGEIQKLKELQIKYAANKRYNEMIDTLTANKFEIEQEIEIYKAWIKLTDVNGLQNSASTAQFVELASSMNKYIQAVFGEAVSARFNIEAKANSFSFGIVRDDKYIPFNLLSSGEKCMYTLALMLNIIELSNTELKLLMVDDLLDHLDDVNITKMFKSLESITSIQMIFAGVKSVDDKYVMEVSK